MDNSDCWFQQDTQNLIVNFKKRKSVCNHLEMVVTGKNRCFPEVRIRSDQYPKFSKFGTFLVKHICFLLKKLK